MTINVAKLPSDISRPLRSLLIMRRGSYNDLRISFLIPICGRRASVRPVRLLATRRRERLLTKLRPVFPVRVDWDSKRQERVAGKRDS
jgi:hypothetical protein